MQAYQKEFIEMALAHQALRFGEFTLKSGRKSPYFFNVGQLNTGKVLKQLGQAYATALSETSIPFDMLFGPAYKGVPLVCTTSIAMSTLYQKDLPFAFNRKEAKAHGEKGQIVGAPITGNVLIVDDVITAGTAIREAFDIIERHQGIVAGILVALDRQEKGQGGLSAIDEIREQFKVQVHALVTFEDILEYIEKNPLYQPHLEAMKRYRDNYGVIGSTLV